MSTCKFTIENQLYKDLASILYKIRSKKAFSETQGAVKFTLNKNYPRINESSDKSAPLFV